MIKTSLKELAKIVSVFAVILVGSSSLSAQNRTVNGVVVDESNEPIIGAAVVVVGNNTVGTMTNIDGAFSLNVPANTSLEVSCIGYATQVVPVGTQSNLRVILVTDSEFLEETVVIGYGVQKKSDLTGSVASVRSDDLKNRSTTDAAAALQGKAAGVQILNNSGAPGSSASIRVRGYSSNSSSIGPLLIVDGLKVSSIQYLDPSLIESMEVLKDAASAAIYGAQAGNGVVLITTKTGASNEGRSSVTYNGKYSLQSLGKKAELFDAESFIDYMTYVRNDFTGELESARYDGTKTDWFDVLFGPSWSKQHSVSFQGGNNKGHFFSSINYVNNDGIVRGERDVYKRLTFQVNADYQIFKWLQVGVNNSIEKWDRSSVSSGGKYSSVSSVLQLDPLTPVYYDDPSEFPGSVKQYYDMFIAGESKAEILKDPTNGRYYAISRLQPENDTGNPLLQRDRSKSSSEGLGINGTAFANLTPLKGLTFTSRFGYRISLSNSNSFDRPYFATKQAQSDTYSISASASNGYYYQWENFANYNLNLKKHNLTVMAGMSYNENKSNSVTGSARGSDILTEYADNFQFLSYVNSNEDTNKSISNLPSKSASIAYFGRLTYSYDNRYSFQANFRADAFDSSKLSKQSRWGYFPSFSAGWTISNESFVKDNISRDILSFLKLRASWGRNGNVSALGNYQYSTTISTNSKWYQYHLDTPEQSRGSAPSGIANPGLKWETSDQIDLGLDARFFTNRLTLGVDWYKKNTRDLLTPIAILPEIGGSGNMTVNAGSIENSGVEFEMGWKDSIGDFHYSINGNLATLKNKVTYLDPSYPRILGQQGGGSGSNNLARSIFEVGYPVWYFEGYQFEGVDSETGKPIYKDVNEDGVISNADMAFIGKPIPDITYGLTINLEYKGIDLSMFGTGVAGNDIFNLYFYTSQIRNSLRYFWDNAWTPTNKAGTMPDPKSVYNEWTFWSSSALAFKGDFFKIKQLQLGYTLPEKLTNKVAVSNLRLYVSFDDFFTFTKYPGMDPETATTSSHNGMGFDFGTYPTMKKVVFGVNLTF